ncbi:MAG: hypothetical protein C7B45_14925 [Sulfobacillus acidophilus]|uniref:Cas12f1-like TNB domain-containing protein n=1 Tax=Sulfobacillus acidophilus TaxID=53633 RepID=A0A2T2WE10_9FIRM|nr:MAG: hypothetical protein C7B45_14925 [Sulfobacillus acidophilus]
MSWAFYRLRQMVEYKAALHQARTGAVDLRYTSQTCPKCGRIARDNRARFACQQCPDRSNDHGMAPWTGTARRSTAG